MRTIYKYEIPVADDFTLHLPARAKVLTVDNQFGEPHIWCEVETLAGTEPRLFSIIGTGHEIPSGEGFQYVGTFQQAGGKLVWHLYEVRP